jgi:hypothetical protein
MDRTGSLLSASTRAHVRSSGIAATRSDDALLKSALLACGGWRTLFDRDGRHGKWNSSCETAAADTSTKVHSAAKVLRDADDDWQAESAAVRTIASHAKEAIGQTRDVFRPLAGAAISDRQHDRKCVAPDRDLDPTALIAILDRIVNQVVEHDVYPTHLHKLKGDIESEAISMLMDAKGTPSAGHGRSAISVVPGVRSQSAIDLVGTASPNRRAAPTWEI